MPGFTKNAFRTPLGRNVFLRSTRDVKTISGMFATSTLPFVTIDGFPNQKVLQPGVVLAKITSGPEINKVGPYLGTAGTNEVQTLTATGTWSAGTYTLTVMGGTTTALAFDATAATVQAAVRLAVEAANPTFEGDNITVTGGPLSTTPLVVTFLQGGNIAAITWDISLITGAGPGLGVAETTPGVAGATDGRQTAANIVGINNTFLPTQLVDGDREVAIIYEAAVVQANCYEMNSAGLFIPLSNTTAGEMFAKKSLDIKFF